MTTGPDLVERYNVFPAARVLGAPAPGYSSGQALDAMEELASEHLPDGYTLAWSTQSCLERQLAGSSAGLNILGRWMVCLIIAAQYERRALPLSVILSIPFALCGGLTAGWRGGLQKIGRGAER